MKHRLHGTGTVFLRTEDNRWFAAISHGSGKNRVQIRRSAKTREEAEAKLRELGGGNSYADEFWRRVEKTDGCWLWRGKINNARGYGWYRGKLAHRVALELDGRPPGELHVLHSCDNPSCVRPSHLRPGTAAENGRDRVEHRLARAAAGDLIGDLI